MLRERRHEPRALLLLARALVEIVGTLDAARSTLLGCLRYTSATLPGHAECAAALGHVDALIASQHAADASRQQGDTAQLTAVLERLVALDARGPTGARAAHELCELGVEAREADAALRRCTLALSRLAHDPDTSDDLAAQLYGNRAWALSVLGRYDEALLEIGRAMELNGTDNGFVKLKSLIEQALSRTKPDYYATLGVPRTATVEEIKEAFRRLARKWHPDKTQDAQAQHMFMQILEAYEVLVQPHLRERYDRGEDAHRPSAEGEREPQSKLKFRFHADGDRVRAWFVDPQTGSKEWVDLPTPSTDSPVKEHRPLPMHCCLGE